MVFKKLSVCGESFGERLDAYDEAFLSYQRTEIENVEFRDAHFLQCFNNPEHALHE